MRTNGNVALRTLIILIVASVLTLIGFSAIGVYWHIDTQAKQAVQRRDRMLCETNYPGLLAACREISTQVARGEMRPGCYSAREHPDPNVSRLPALIRGLEPAYVVAEQDGRIVVELVGGPFASFQAIAYPDGYAGPHDGDIELIPNLWYSDEDYPGGNGNTQYKMKIDALIEKGRSRQQSVGSGSLAN